MAFSIHYKIQFVTLRSGQTLTVNIWKDGTPSQVLYLHGGTEPFTTTEDDDEDLFTPIRTQSGYIRIVDNGYAYPNANMLESQRVSFSWTSLIPATDVSNPVTLTDSSNNMLWQGFMQAQDFGSVIYGNPQEREFPVQCPLSILQGLQPQGEIVTKNFAYLLSQTLASIPSTITISSVYVQGGSYAQGWLLKMLDWQVFMNVGSEDDEDDISPRYSYYDMLEDMCRYWGWTARIYRQALYLMRVDDSSNDDMLTLTRTQLTNMATNETAYGSVSDLMTTVALPEYYASTDNEVSTLRGYSRAVVTCDVGDTPELINFAPPSIERWLESIGSYIWVGKPDSTSIGYFTTPTTNITHMSQSLIISATYQSGGYCRRQIYTSDDAEEPVMADVIDIIAGYTPGTAVVQLQSRRNMSFGEGSLRISAEVFEGYEKPEGLMILRMRIGIGDSRENARWWYCDATDIRYNLTIGSGWSSAGTVDECMISVNEGTLEGSTSAVGYFSGSGITIRRRASFDAIPVTSGLHGYLFVDFLGATNILSNPIENFQVVNFKIEFSRDSIVIPTVAGGSTRARSLIEKRVDSRDYSGTSGVNARGEWSVDNIFASDNNMNYGVGLLMNADGTYMGQATYGNGSYYPEQHMVNRVTTHWATSKSVASVEMQSNYVDSYTTPLYMLTLGGTTYYPVSVSHNWRDDVTKIKMLEI